MRISAIFVAKIVALSLAAQDGVDWRNIRDGRVIPTSSYADQPYIVKTDDGAWLCIVTTGAKKEGDPGQTVAVLRSKDKGKTWTAPLPLEPTDGPEASYAVLLKTPSGRIYAFYNHNTDNVREVPRDFVPGKPRAMEKRVDSLGHFVFRYSDDHGVTWSPKRYDVPMREFEIDRANLTNGKIKFFWNVGKPFVRGGSAYVSIHKVGGFGEGFFTGSEGAFLKSDNILTERDPELIRWITLPEGDVGLRTPHNGGPIAEEQSTVVLSDGTLYCVYRTIDGHPANSISRNGGRTWSEPDYLTYADGRRIKHPRAADFVWKCSNGKYLYWFHNHGGKFIAEHPQRRSIAYEDRNPAWLCGGVETDTPDGKTIKWSQPEIVLYDDDPMIRMSYPDLIEDGGYFLTETQKNIARVHEIDANLIEGLWSQFDEPTSLESNKQRSRESLLSLVGVVFDKRLKDGEVKGVWKLPPLPPFLQRDNARPDHGAKDLRRGFTIEAWIRVTSDERIFVVHNRDVWFRGFSLLSFGATRSFELRFDDGPTNCRWESDKYVWKMNEWTHVVVIVDGGPKIVRFVVNGRLCDGGDQRQFGWGRFSPHYRGPQGGELEIERNFTGDFARVRIFNRALRTSEAVNEYRLGVERHLKK
jgi:Concanavalin A-like lectin/glucanases superfamily/BNR/Asp-box repeat